MENIGLRQNHDFFAFDRKVKVHGILERSDEKGEAIYPVVDKTKDHKIIGTILDHSSILEATSENPAHIRRVYVTSSAKDRAEKALQSLDQRIPGREQRKKRGRNEK